MLWIKNQSVELRCTFAMCRGTQCTDLLAKVFEHHMGIQSRGDIVLRLTHFFTHMGNDAINILRRHVQAFGFSVQRSPVAMSAKGRSASGSARH